VRKGFETPFAEKDTVQSPHVESSRGCPEVSLLEYSVAEDVSEVASSDLCRLRIVTWFLGLSDLSNALTVVPLVFLSLSHPHSYF